MIRNLKNLFTFLAAWIPVRKKFGSQDTIIENSCMYINSGIEIEIIWDDIIDSIPASPSECSIARALKREGIQATVTDYSLILSDGTEYHPDRFSDHWRSFMGSSKLKPKKIKYNRF